MSFENPKGLWMLLGIPVLIFIHLVKSKHEDQPVSSTYLWKLAERFMKQVLPMQRLKRFLVFLFQLLAVAGTALIVAKPVIYSGNSIKYIAVLDASASMLTADEKGETRFDRALEEVRKLTKKINNGHTLSVMYASDDVYYLIQDSSSISDVGVILDNVSCSKGGCDIDAAVALAQETADRYPDTEVVLFTDAECTDMHNIDVVYVGDDVWNAAVLSLSGEEKNDLVEFTGSVISTGIDSMLPVGLEVDGQVLDVQLVECTADVPAEVKFSLDANRYGNYSKARIFLDIEDGLRDDNSYSLCVENPYHWKIMLIGNNPRFLRSALESVPHVTLRTEYKIPDDLSETGFLMFVFDGIYPEEYPADVPVVIFGDGNLPEGITAYDSVDEPAKLRKSEQNASPLHKDLVLDSTYIRRYTPIKGNALWDSVLQCGEDTVAVSRKSSDGTATTVFSFDVHDTNLPLQSDLSVLMRNVVKYSLPWMLEENDASVGEELRISLVPYEDTAFLILPDGTRQDLTMEQASTVFTPTDIGIYRVAEKSEEKMIYKDFFVHIPISESSVQKLDGITVDRSAGDMWGRDDETAPKAATKLSVWIAAGALLIILAEWGLSCREEL
ncbi:MAG: BatA and WFA domain-containing protein [Oscillospiraceae bacterium]|nr:BatA and WFA domain-containing protein [Oscillospiraceae bacterium]MBQ5412759.1 BatA and WFA domain-containing protein [Oscillospiraceae bacterium]